MLLREENDKLIDQIRNDLDKQWKLMTKTLAKLREEYEKLEKAAKAALDEMMRIQNYEHKKNTIIKDDDPTNDNPTSPTSPDSPSNPKKDNKKEDDDPKKEKGEVPSPDIMKGVAACIWYGVGAGGWETNPGRKEKLTEKFTEEGQQKRLKKTQMHAGLAFDFVRCRHFSSVRHRFRYIRAQCAELCTQIQVMEKSFFLIAYIYKDCIQRGHHFLHSPVVDIPHCEVVLVPLLAVHLLQAVILC